MEMTNAEIVRQYKEAKQKNKKIRILAQLNACPESTIKEILIGAGAIEEKQTAKPKTRLTDRSQRIAVPEAVIKVCENALDSLENNMRNCKQTIDIATQQLKAVEDEYRIISDFMKGVTHE